MINMNGKVVEVTVPRHESGELCGSLGIEIKEVKFTDLSGGKRRMVMVDFSPNALVPLPAPSIIFAIGGTDISKKNLNLGEVITDTAKRAYIYHRQQSISKSKVLSSTLLINSDSDLV